ncbi:MAG: tetratricopeptide repeat protein [Thermoanaerobaculia bacterium]
MQPDRLPGRPGRVLVVEAEAGEPRRRWLEQRLQEAASASARTWLLSCRFADGGPWAGVHDLFASLSGEIRDQRPELLVKHDYELVHVLPELKRWMAVRNPTLTDLAPQDEKVRNYPADRAIRIVHGLIDLLVELKGAAEVPWVIACDGYEAVGSIGHRFFQELARRRGGRLGLRLLLGTVPGSGEALAAQFGAAWEGPLLRLDLPAVAAPEPDRVEMARLAQALEDEVGADDREAHIRLPELIRAWRLAGRPEKVAQWQFKGLELFNTLGFYDDAIRYGESVRQYVKREPDEQWGGLRWSIFIKLYMSYLALSQPETAERLAQEDAIGRVEDPRKQARLSYLLAMLYSRFQPNRDLARGEQYLAQGLSELGQAEEMSEDEYHFQSVFNRNGLAMIRHFQKRYQEAVELCREGYRELELHLAQDRHRLHRSVLLFNMAQVYAAVGAFDEALRHFSLAMEMDPNYSEYYNDRGNVYLKMGRLAEAEADYLQAIALSPPYHEVFTNLGQCYRRMGRWDDAVRAYSVALDLEPGQPLALGGRGQCYEATGRLAEAEADYSASLALDAGQWDVLASRAVLRYMAGDLAASLSDLDRAVELAPQNPDLYQNRAVALADLGRCGEAARDLATYLRLQPGAEDRQEVELRLQALLAATPEEVTKR